MADSQMRLEFGILGLLTVAADGVDVAVQGSRRRSLLSRLLLSANRSIPVDRLADDLWNGSPSTAATSTLQSHISWLRQIVGTDRLLHRHGGYMLVVNNGEFDRDEFERLSQEGRELLSAGLPERARDLLNRALDLWRGPPLSDVADAIWAEGEIRHLEELKATTFESSLEARIRLHDYAGAIAEAERAVREYPYRERLWAHLMLALYRSGRQSESVGAFQRARRLLADELGLEPSRELAQLEHAILIHDRSLDPSEAAPTQAGPPGHDNGPGTTAVARQTLLFTDIVGSVSLWEHDPESMSAAIRHHHEQIAVTVARHQGRVVNPMGDGAYVTFGDPVNAIRAAVELQRAVAAREWPGVGALRVRMGLNSGDCQLYGSEVYGRPVNVAARLQSIAHGGQIVLSDATLEECEERLPEDLGTRALGAHWLRGVPEPVVVYMVIADGLPTAFPPLLASTLGHEDLPSEVGPLVGRADVIAQLTDDIARSRLLTLWGPGGVGKTRVALRIASQMRRPFTDGVHFADLSTVRAEGQVGGALVTLLHAQPVDVETAEQTIIRVMRPLRLLLVLDNAEHVRAEVAGLVQAIHAECPGVHILVTSREALDTDGERRFPIGPLPVPNAEREEAAYVAGFESAQLFAARAREVQPGFVLDEYHAPFVGRLCRALDGLPLALELAASRLDVETIEELAASADQLGSRLQRGSGQARHDSLVRSLEWSWDQLTPAQRVLFGALATFSGGFSRQQAAELSDGEELQSDLDRLVHCSLVVREPEGARFYMLQTTRQFARSLQSDAAGRELRRRHALVMMQRARGIEPQYMSGGQAHACRRLRAEFPDLRDAMQHSLEERMLDEGAGMLTAIFQPAFNQLIAEVSDWAIELARVIPDEHPKASEVCGAASLAAWSRGDSDIAVALAERAIACADGNPGGSSIWARTALQNALAYAGRTEEVVPHYLAQVQECRASTNPYWNVQGLGFEALSFMMAGKTERARDRIDAALRLARKLANPDCLHWALYCLGRLLRFTNLPAASEAFAQAIEAVRSVDSRLYLILDLLEWVGVRRVLGDSRSAAVGLVELLNLINTSGTKSQLSKAYSETAQLLIDEGNPSAAAIVWLGRAGLPVTPGGELDAGSEKAILERLQMAAGADWPVLEVRALAMTDEALLHFSGDQLEQLLLPVASSG